MQSISASSLYKHMPSQSVKHTHRSIHSYDHKHAQESQTITVQPTTQGKQPQLHPNRRKGNGLSLSPGARGLFIPFSCGVQSHHSVHCVRGCTYSRSQTEQRQPPSTRHDRASLKRGTSSGGNSLISASVTCSRLGILARVRRASSRRDGGCAAWFSVFELSCAVLVSTICPSMFSLSTGLVATRMASHASAGGSPLYLVNWRASCGIPLSSFGPEPRYQTAISDSSISGYGFGRAVKCFNSPCKSPRRSHGR